MDLVGLPHDMLTVILGFVEIYDLSSVARVCKRWNNITLMPTVRDGMLGETKNSAIRGDTGGYVCCISIYVMLF
jgi:hypothetical protein